MKIDLKKYDKIIYNLFADNISYHGYTRYYYKFKKSNKTKYVNIKYYINNRFDNITFGLHEILFRIKNNIDICPCCKICGEPVKYNKKLHTYKKYCCISCRMKDNETQQHIHNVAIQRYGSINNSKRIHEQNMKRSPEEWNQIIDKRHQTNELLYGNKNYVNVKQRKETCLDKYGVTCTLLNDDVHKKTILTLIKNYGVDHQSKSQIIKDKISKSIKKYWDNLSDEERNERINKLVLYWSNLSKDELIEHGKKIKNNYLNKSLEEKQKISEIAKKRAIKYWESLSEDEVNEIFKKIKETQKLRTQEQIETERKNRSNAIKKWKSKLSEKQKQETIKKLKETLSKRTIDDWKIITDKIDNTKRINKTYNTSNDEELCYEYLCKFTKNVKRQYKCVEYPFKADFVIFDFDKPIFIEYQGTWTHGFHPFNINNENDIKRLKNMSKKMSYITSTEHRASFYESAIKTWTIYDVKKRETAKKNNLIYYEVWSYEEFKELINKLYK